MSSLFLISAPAASASTVFAESPEGNYSGSAAAGDVAGPHGIAIDQTGVGGVEPGTLYIADGTDRVDVFSAAGAFRFAFGFGVRTGAAELQTCTAATGCQVGQRSSAPGATVTPRSVAVDPATGDVYVSELITDRVTAFSPAGEFLLELGAGVDTTPGTVHPNLCTKADLQAGDTCGAGTRTSAPGGFEDRQEQLLPVAFDPSGDLWVGGYDRVQRFSSGGQFLSQLDLLGGDVVSMAIDSAGDFYLVRREEAATSAAKLGPSGEQLLALDSGGRPTALTLDLAGDPLIGDGEISRSGSPPTYSIKKFDPAGGSQLQRFADGEIPLEGLIPEGNDLAYGQSASHLYVVYGAPPDSRALYLDVPPPGPLLTAGSEAASPVEPTTATLRAKLNPEGKETNYRFQYIAEAAFQANVEAGRDGFQGATESPNAALPASFEYEPVQAVLPPAALQPETAYRFRLHAVNPDGETKGPAASFTTPPAIEISGSSALAVSATSAMLEAQLNPLGPAATYRVLYGTTAGYGSESGTVILPAGSSPVSATLHLMGLQPHTTYHYLFLAEDQRGGQTLTARGPDLTFTTQAASFPAALPDGRAYEQVSPPEKHGAAVEPISETGLAQAAASGDGITYLASSPTEPEPQGYGEKVQLLSRRAGTKGWSTRDIATPHSSPRGLKAGYGEEYRYFSTDLSLGLVEPINTSFTSLAPEAFPPDTERTPYLRHDFTCEAEPATCYQPLLTGAPGFADVPEGTRFGVSSTFTVPAALAGASSDATHVVLRSPVPLAEATPAIAPYALYEFSAAAPPIQALQPISFLPVFEEGGRAVGGLGQSVSEDGSRVIWSNSAGTALYLRDTKSAETLRLDVPQGGSGAGETRPTFQWVSTDASRIFFTDRQRLTASAGTRGADLYECRVIEAAGHIACALTDLTPETGGEPAQLQGDVLGASADGSSLFFVAAGALVAGTVEHGAGPEAAQPGRPNLYVDREGRLTYIATLSGEDEPDWSTESPRHTSRVSPNGRYLAFMSARQLTGYDNRDAASGQSDQEVFLYDSEANGGEGSLVCASCNPTGARPRGVEYGYSGENVHLVGGNGVWPSHQWLAANIPGWTPYELKQSFYQSRYLSDSGRLFFNSSDVLVPSDTNGAEDVYQYEPLAVGGCSESSPSFSSRSAGCSDLISSGTSGEESAFLDASETGEDVFFLTTSRLALTDSDTALDIYDAHVCTSASPCPPGPPPPAPECGGDACQPPTEAPNALTPGSLSYRGPGNEPSAPADAKKRPAHPRRKRARHKRIKHKLVRRKHRGHK